MNLSKFYLLKQLLQEPERGGIQCIKPLSKNVINPEIKLAIHESLSTNVI